MADVVRGVEMFRHPQVGVPVWGVIENMAWFTPDELPDNRYYIFGRGGAERYAAGAGIDLLAQIPIIQSIMRRAATRVARQRALIRASNLTTERLRVALLKSLQKSVDRVTVKSR